MGPYWVEAVHCLQDDWEGVFYFIFKSVSGKCLGHAQLSSAELSPTCRPAADCRVKIFMFLSLSPPAGMLTITDFIIILHRYYKSPLVGFLCRCLSGDSGGDGQNLSSLLCCRCRFMNWRNTSWRRGEVGIKTVDACHFSQEQKPTSPL